MSRRYTRKEKQQALDAVAAGESLPSVATAQNLSVSTLRRWTKAAEPAAVADVLQLIVIDTASDIPKIARILTNEHLTVTVTALVDHSHAQYVDERFAWKRAGCVVDLDTASARRTFDLIQRGGRDLPAVVLATPGQFLPLDEQPLIAPPVWLDTDSPGMLGAMLDREYQLFRQRARIADYETHIRQLQKCYQNTFTASPEAVAIVTASGHCYANPAWLRLAGGQSLEQLKDVPFTRLLTDQSLQDFLALLEQLAQPCANARIDLELQSGTRGRAEITRLPGAEGEFQVMFVSIAAAQQQSVLSRPGAADIAAAAIAPAATVLEDEPSVWNGRLVRALQDEQLFSLLYQPIVGLSGGASGMYEALLRLSDSKGGEYLPGSFMPAAKCAGLMGRIDRWVIQRVLRVMQAQHAASLTLFVNLSGDSLLDPTFPVWLKSAIDTAGVDARHIVLDISRRDVIQGRTPACAAISAIRAIGCAVALDDFCVQSAAAGLLRDCAVDFVKFERSAVVEVAHSDTHLEQIKMIVEVAATAGVKTIASYVQEADSVSRLWHCGVDYVQGYFLQHPSQALDYDFADEEQEESESSRSVF
ncbi:MAG: EAL domain-containing protein [Thiogranum sp.]|nr:EAL domain-containing protein [Thiogranum sp.]